MKKTKLLICLLSLTLTIITFTIGLTFAGTTTDAPSSIPTTSPTPTETTPTLNVPSGTYYYIVGTPSAYNGTASSLQNLAKYFPQITINGNQYNLQYNNILNGSAYSHGESVIFENQAEVEELVQIDTPHDENWYLIYNPKQIRDWTCTYDNTNKTITIVHNSDFIQLKHFETIEQYIQYLTDTYVQDGYFNIYPKPFTLNSSANISS